MLGKKESGIKAVASSLADLNPPPVTAPVMLLSEELTELPCEFLVFIPTSY